MTIDRAIELLTLVMEANKQLEKRDGISAALEVSMYHEDLYIYIFKPTDGISMHDYTTSGITKEVVHNGIRTIADPDLEQGEEHLRRLIDELDG